MDAKELQNKGYHAFSWGDFWKTGMTATSARSYQKGYRKDGYYRKSKSQMWDVTTGPRGGVWIRYTRI